MADKLPHMTLKAIGFVRNEVEQPMREGWEKVVSEIVVDESLTEALDRLDEFSHIIVLSWLHRVATTTPPPLKIHPMGRQEAPLVGLVATRSPNRPNPLGKTTVRLLERQGNVLKVKGLDAIDGTPVVDIKPYNPGYDSVADAKVAPWITDQ